ncbi:S41 family peptidase [Candidatus Moduliflexota bacterium]
MSFSVSKMIKRGAAPALAILLLSSSVALAFPNRGGRLFTPPSLTHQVFQYVEWKYVDPERSLPDNLIDGAFKSLETRYPEILIERDPDRGEIVVRVDEKAARFPLAPDPKYGDAATVIEDTLAFASPLLKDEVDEKMLRYMTINGALKELDPHSNVFSKKHYKDFKIRTSGSFGGIGFTFGIQDGDLTIISPIPSTPADRAGLQSGDNILFIDGEPTTNMGTDTAVGKMRGKPGTKVTLTIGREGWSEPRDFPIIREIINIVSVEKFRLEGDGEAPVLYVSIKNFQEHTADELRQAIADGDSEEIAGVIIDLRNNPGGLLQQAIAVSDGFLDEGIIVSTRSRGSDKTARFAERLDTPFTDKPVVILINRGSASASEIVAGALQETRALIIGQKSFGKGSVQQAYQLMDGGGLLLTVSQYLTPGDISIQSIGIQPDIVVTPVEIGENRLRLGKVQGHAREATLENAFSDWGNAHRKAEAEIRYLRAVEEKDRSEDFKLPPTSEKVNDLKEEFEIRLARKILGATGEQSAASPRKTLLAATRNVLGSLSGTEKELISRALSDVGVNWTAMVGEGGEPKLSVSFPDDLSLLAGSKSKLEVSVKNEGKKPVFQVWGDMDSENPLLKNVAFAFGQIGPGEERLWSAEIDVPKSADDRWDTVTMNLKTSTADDAGSFTGGVLTRSGPLPSFAYDYRLTDENSDSPSRSGDGIIEKGERVRLLLTVTNVGDEASPVVDVNLHADEKEKFYLDEVRHRLEGLQPGESREVPLSFRLLEAKEGGEVEVRITLSDREHGKFFADSLKFQTGKSYPSSQSRTPPRFELSGALPVRTDADHVVLRFEVRDDESVKEVYAYRGDKKFTYIKNREGGAVFPVELKIPLDPGSNRLVIFARDQKNIVSQKVFFVFRADKGKEFSEVLFLPPVP